jgi:transposase-like protein
MTTRKKHKAKLLAVEAVAGDRDRMKALVAALAEMVVQGVSTRKVKAITEELCGHSFSASTMSSINKRLDAALDRFANRRLQEDYPYLIPGRPAAQGRR